MKPFTRLRSIGAPLLENDIDTDALFPARFLLLPGRLGLGEHLFSDRRRGADGAERPEFVLNQEAYRDAQVLLAGANFGCGSSREQAVWALADFGIRCVIAPSFGEIFAANCINNGVLPISLPENLVAEFASHSRRGTPLMIDLEAQSVSADGRATHPFDIRPELREGLLRGWDTTEQILALDSLAIEVFEQRHRSAQPWLFD